MKFILVLSIFISFGSLMAGDIPNNTAVQDTSNFTALSNSICDSNLLKVLSSKDSLSSEETKLYLELLKMCQNSDRQTYSRNNSEILRKKSRRTPLILLGGISFYVSYHFLKKAHDKSVQIRGLNDNSLGMLTGDLKSDQTYATLAGIGFSVLGAVLCIEALRPVEVVVTTNSLSLLYHL